jgi:hypothetical protein
MPTIKTIAITALACLAFAATHVIAAPIDCKSDKAFKGGASAEWSLSLEITGDKVVGLDYSGVMSNGQEGGAYFCEINAAEKNKDSKWVRKGNNTLVTGFKGDDESNLEIVVQPNGDYKVSFESMKTIPYCGFGAEFPQYVVLQKGRKTCIVK